MKTVEFSKIKIAMIRTIIAAVCIATATVPSYSYTLVGMGNVMCNDALAYHVANNGKQFDSDLLIWTGGYITGVNSVLKGVDNAAAGFLPAAVVALILADCQEKPSQHVGGAVARVMFNLIAAQRIAK